MAHDQSRYAGLRQDVRILNIAAPRVAQYGWCVRERLTPRASAVEQPSVERRWRVVLAHRQAVLCRVSGRTYIADPNFALAVEEGAACELLDFKGARVSREGAFFGPVAIVRHDAQAAFRSPIALIGVADRARVKLHCLQAQGAPVAEILSLVGHALSDGQVIGGAVPEPLDRVRLMLNERAASRWQLVDVADRVGLSPRHLTSEFSRVFGLPVYRYHLRLRLNQALIELPQSDSITDLALSLGFSSHSHFTAAFTSTFGVAPSAYVRAAAPSVVGARSAQLALGA